MNFFISLFCSMAYLAANSCAMAALYAVFSIVEGTGESMPALGIWLSCLCLCQLGMTLFLRKARSERSVIYFCAVFFALQLVLSFLIHGFFSSFFTTLVAVAMWLYSYFSSFELSIKGISPERLTKSFDLCCLVLIFVLFFSIVKSTGLRLVLPVLVSTLLCLFALMLIRGGEQRKLRGALLGSGLVLAFGAVAALLAALFSGGIRQLVNILLLCLRYIGRAIDAIFTFLINLLPSKHYDYELPEPIEGAALPPMEDMGFELMDPQVIIIAALALGFAAALAAIILHIARGKRPVNMRRIGGEKNIKRRRTGLGTVLAKAFKALWARINFFFACIVKRNTAPGLLLEIEKRSRAQLHGRSQSETCREFLSRACAVYPHAGSELMQLADNMDSLYFGSGVTLSNSEISRMRSLIFNKE